jgi:hypothetical protein
MRGVVLCLLAACGQVSVSHDASIDSGGDDTGGAKSGTRLKIEWRDFGGTRIIGDLYDTQRNEACYATDWSDGNTYCSPSDINSTVYANATCTQIVGQVYHDTGCTQPPPAYFIQYDNTGCGGGPTHIYPRGPKLAVTQYYYKQSDGTCAGPYTTTNYDFYQVGTEVAPSSFVQLMRGAPIGSSRLAQRFYTSADGAQLPASLHDAQLGTDCFLSYQYGGATSGSCVPSQVRYASYYHDASCTQGEFSITSSCPRPAYAEQSTNASCPGSPLKYFNVGAATAASPLFYKSGPTCTMTTGSMGQTYYTLGTEITLASLPRSHDTTPNRSVELIHYTDGTATYADYSLYDVAHDTECYPYTLSDKSVRCLPQAGGVSSYFKDANCAQPIDVLDLYTGGSTCGPPPLPSYAMKYIRATSGTCGYTYEIYSVGAPYTGPLYQNVGTCQQVTSTTSLFYSLGAQHPLTEFPTGTLVRDP